MPVDIGPKLIPTSPLKSPLIKSLPPNDKAKEMRAVSQIIDLLRSRKNPVIVVDGGKLSTSLPVWKIVSKHMRV